MSDKVLVLIGGAGNIGSEVILLANKVGYETVSFNTKKSKFATHSKLVDISNEEELRHAFKGIKHINALVCLAEISYYINIENLSWELWKKVMEVNVRGTMLSLKYASKLLQKGSSIVLKTSAVENAGVSGHLTYQTSKGAVLGLMRAASGGFAERDIRVNAVCSKFTDLSPNNTITNGRKTEKKITPVNGKNNNENIVKSKEIAEGIMFLISTEASFITGTELVI